MAFNPLSSGVNSIARRQTMAGPSVPIIGTAISDIFRTGGTWKKPVRIQKFVRVIVIGGGGGGGAGCRRATSTNRYGGCGGAGGGVSIVDLLVDSLPDEVTITVGAGGSGAASVTTDNANGGTGGDGGLSRFGADGDLWEILAGGGLGGTGGSNNTATGPVGGYGASDDGGAGGDSGGGVGKPDYAGTHPLKFGLNAGGGGCGGWITSGNATNNGATGGMGGATYLGFGAGGVAVTSAGGPGRPTSPIFLAGGAGAGGGGCGSSSFPGSDAFAGGAGGYFGGGGGGGGASTNGLASGAGGNGCSGAVIILCW